MATVVPPARQLLRAKDLIDAWCREPLDVAALARAVSEVCFAVGLRSVGSFTTSFGRAYGVPPAAYRAEHPPAVTHVGIPTGVLLAHARQTSGRV